MLILNPSSVTFGGHAWNDVQYIAIERSTARLAVERSDAGPHIVFADAAEESVTLRVGQLLAGQDDESLRCGDMQPLVFFAGYSAGSAGRERITATAVVRSVRYEFSPSRSAQRVVSLIAISPDGNSDPVAREIVQE